MSAKIYEVFVPILGSMKVYLRANDKEQAIQSAYRIAKEMKQNASETIVPNLFTWELDGVRDPIVIEKGEADE